MGKMKDLVTDKTFVLASTVKTPVTIGKKVHEVDLYTYKCEETGAVIGFYSHPTKAWNWGVDLTITNQVGQVVMNYVIDAFVQASMDRGEKSFEDAIKELKLG